MQDADLSGLPDPSPFPLEGPLPEQGGQDHEAVEAGDVFRGVVLFKIALHRGLGIPSRLLPPLPKVPAIPLASCFFASILSWPRQGCALP